MVSMERVSENTGIVEDISEGDQSVKKSVIERERKKERERD